MGYYDRGSSYDYRPRPNPVDCIKRGDLVTIHGRMRLSDGTVIPTTKPAIVISNNLGNAYSKYVTIAYMSDEFKRLDMKTHAIVEIDGKQYMITAERIASVAKDMISFTRGHLNEEGISKLNRCIKVALGMEDEPWTSVKDENGFTR